MVTEAHKELHKTNVNVKTTLFYNPICESSEKEISAQGENCEAMDHKDYSRQNVRKIYTLYLHYGKKSS